MKRILTAVSLLILLLTTSFAVAAPDADAARIFDDGRQLYEDGKYHEALSKFQKTLALMDSPNARLYVARTLHELGRTVEAYEEMVRAKEQAAALGDPKYVRTRDIAAARLAILEKEIGRIIVVLSDDEELAKLTVGTREIPSERIGKIVAVEPGKVVVVAATADGEEVREEANVAAGALVTVSLDIGTDYTDEPAAAPPTQSGPAPVPAGDSPADTDEGGLGALTTTGIVLAGVGVAGLVVFGVAGGMALDSHSGISDECGGVACPETRYNEEIDDGQTLQLVANVGFGVGVGGVAVGTALILIGTLTGDDDDSPSSDGVAVQAGPQGAFLGYSASF